MSRPIIYLLTVVLLLSCEAYGQSFYRLQYRSEPENQDGLLILYGDGTGLLRSRSANPNVAETLVTEFTLEERYARSKDGSPVDEFIYYETISVRNVKGGGIAPASLRLWFKLNEASGFFEPWATSAVRAADIPAANNLVSAELLESDALKKDLVLNYFSKFEDIYQTIFATRVRGLSPAEKKIRLRLLVVANTNDKSIGASCRLDMLRMQETFTDITEYLGIGFSIDTIAGDRFNKKNVIGAVEQLRGSPADILVFYYSGHGFRKPTDKRKFPYLELRGRGEKDYMTNSMNIEDVYKMLLGNTKARLKLVISDCCNAEITATNTEGTPVSGKKSSGFDWEENNIKQLFFNSRKAILVTSADMGQLAAGNKRFGGFFSYFFKSSLENHFSILKKNVTWDQVLQEAKKLTIKKAENTCCQKPCSAATACRQLPSYMIR